MFRDFKNMLKRGLRTEYFKILRICEKRGLRTVCFETRFRIFLKSLLKNLFYLSNNIFNIIFCDK